MSETKCYLCKKPGKLQKLFRKCKHESACHECLRDRYVIKPQHEEISEKDKRFLCFHPECNLVVRNTQIKRLVRSQKELQRYYDLKYEAKLHKLEAENHEELQQARFGPDWVDLVQALGTEILLETCRCPGCKMMITKNGGCDHMTCICGCEFNWSFCRGNVTRSCREVEQKYIEKHAKFENIYAKIKAGAPSPSRKKTKRVKLPPVDDGFMEDFDQDYSSASEEDCAESVNPEISDVYSLPSNLDSSNVLSTSVMEGAVVESPQREEEWEQDFHILELASNLSDDSWTQFEDDSQICNSQATWEEVSEVSSVASFHSKTGMSFLEAASTSNQAPGSPNRWKEVSKPPRPMVRLETIAEHCKPVISKHGPDEHDHVGDFFLF